MINSCWPAIRAQRFTHYKPTLSYSPAANRANAEAAESRNVQVRALRIHVRVPCRRQSHVSQRNRSHAGSSQGVAARAGPFVDATSSKTIVCLGHRDPLHRGKPQSGSDSLRFVCHLGICRSPGHHRKSLTTSSKMRSQSEIDKCPCKAIKVGPQKRRGVQAKSQTPTQRLLTIALICDRRSQPLLKYRVSISLLD